MTIENVRAMRKAHEHHCPLSCCGSGEFYNPDVVCDSMNVQSCAFVELLDIAEEALTHAIPLG